MRQNVKLSWYSIIFSCLCIIFFGGLIINFLNKELYGIACVFIAMILIIIGFSLFYSPIAVSVDDDNLKVHRSLKTKTIPLSEISSVMLVSPTMAEKRIMGSGGWFGYWGRMKEPLLGRYFAYYGKASDCFLVRLKDGSQYLLGCENPASVTDYINLRLS